MSKSRSPHILLGLNIGEVSLVDEPASTGARIVLHKNAASAIPGVAGIRQELEDAHGTEAADVFDNALASVADQTALMLGEGRVEAIEKAAGALGLTISSIFSEDDDTQRPALIAKSAGEFAVHVYKAAGTQNDDPTPLAPVPSPGTQGDNTRVDTDPAANPGGAADRVIPGANVEDTGERGDALDEGGNVLPVAPGMELPVAQPPKPAKQAPAPAGRKPVQKSATDEVVEAITSQTVSIAKAASTFDELNAGREQREKLNSGVYALQDSIHSIMSDAAVGDKAAKIRQSVAEFDRFVEGLAGEVAAAEGASVVISKAADGVARVTIEKAAYDAEQAELAEHRTAARRRTLVAKAAKALPAGGPVEATADALAAIPDGPAQDQMLRVLTAAAAMGGGASSIFKAAGSPTAETVVPETPAESPLVAAARAQAAADAARTEQFRRAH